MAGRLRGLLAKQKLLRFIKIAVLAVLLTIALLSLLGTVAHAAGLVDDTVNADNLYSQYPLENYQLDFYVDNSWAWLPWNWLDGIGKSVQYGLYCITNFVWTISLYLSSATGYVIQQAYKLDFINDMADSIGKSIQTLAGVTQNGFSSSGFYVGFLLLLILIVGIYVAYTGLIKRETSRALHAVINFLVIFVLSASFIAYAPDYIKKINDFSSDISTASLGLGTKILLPDFSSQGRDSVDLIRDSLFAIQIRQPWLLLQFGDSNVENIGSDRVEALVSVSPSAEDGETRENVVKAEIEDQDNDNLSIPQVVNRLGMVFFLLIFNLGITIFVFLLTAMMIFSQILFIIYAMFLPVSFLLAMIPGYENMAKQAIIKVFNCIMTRAGITLIVTVAFSISSMFYNISSGYPFFMIAFLQIVTFAGIYVELGDIMSMFSLNAGDSQNMERRIFRIPYLFMRTRARRLERRMARAVGTGALAGASVGAVANTVHGRQKSTSGISRKQRDSVSASSLGSRVGAKVGSVMDTKNRVKDKATAVKENLKDLPTQTAYAVHSVKERAKENVADFQRGVVQEKQSRQENRAEKRNQHRQSVAQKRMALQRAQESSQTGRKAEGSATAGASRLHERPVTASRPATQKAEPANAAVKSRPLEEMKSGAETPAANRERPATVRVDDPGTGQAQAIRQRQNARQDTVNMGKRQTTRQTVQKPAEHRQSAGTSKEAGNQQTAGTSTPQKPTAKKGRMK